MIVLKDIIQGSDEWFKEKLGKPSASNISKIIQNNRKPSKQREGYLHELAAEILTKTRQNGYKNSNMEEGNLREEESRSYYEMIKGVDVQTVGVVYKDEDKKFLCSPDGLIGEERGLEMKNPIPKTQVKYLLENRIPPEYFGQIQFSLYVTGFKQWDFLSYVPNMKSLLITAERDEVFIAALEFELKSFCKDLEEIVNKIK